MIKDFITYINEDYFSKLANRKDNNEVRKENEVTEDTVRACMQEGDKTPISLRKEGSQTIVDVNGNFLLREDVEEIPFQFGKVTGSFNCYGCSKLKSLKGCPKEVGGLFSCTNCKSLTSLEGCPEIVYNDFYCRGCGSRFTEEYIKSLCDVKGKIYTDL